MKQKNLPPPISSLAQARAELGDEGYTWQSLEMEEQGKMHRIAEKFGLRFDDVYSLKLLLTMPHFYSKMEDPPPLRRFLRLLCEGRHRQVIQALGKLVDLLERAPNPIKAAAYNVSADVVLKLPQQTFKYPSIESKSLSKSQLRWVQITRPDGRIARKPTSVSRETIDGYIASGCTAKIPIDRLDNKQFSGCINPDALRAMEQRRGRKLLDLENNIKQTRFQMRKKACRLRQSVLLDLLLSSIAVVKETRIDS
jgi:hypothetical protein